MEFALVGPAFIALLLMVFEFGFQLAVDLALNFGTTEAARYASTGAVKGTVSDKGSNDTNNLAIANAIVSKSGGWLDVNRVVVSATSYGSTTSYVAGSGASTNSNGSSGSIVVYSVTYDQPFLTGVPGLVACLLSRSGCSTQAASILHHATVIVQNEPY